jgi:hypothetical protein
MKKHERIDRNSDVMSGKPVIKGRRIIVSDMARLPRCSCLGKMQKDVEERMDGNRDD